MSIAHFKNKVYQIYQAQSYSEQQKAFYILCLAFFAIPVNIIFIVYNTSRYLSFSYMTDIKFVIINSISLLIMLVIVASIWKGYYYYCKQFLNIYVFLFFGFVFYVSLERFKISGILTHREYFFWLLAWYALFSTRKTLVSVALIIIIGSEVLIRVSMPDLHSPIDEHIHHLIVNGRLSLIFATIFLYMSSLANENSLKLAESELRKNIDLNNNLESKVKDRTKKLKDIEVSLRKYLPIQLVESITSGKESANLKTERRKLTIFFSDIKGFTHITETLEAEELATILNEYLTEMNTIAQKWGGTVDKFIGDAIMIFFGAPEIAPDKKNALNCVKMAIEMQFRMKELQTKWFNEGFETPFKIRIGISTGTATVGNFGAEERLSYTVIGSQVNIASRLESICEPDQIKISHQTWAFVNDEIECSVGESVQVKGISRNILTYDVKCS